MGMSLVFSALATALAGKPSQRQPGIKTEHTSTGGINPQTFILGTYATAGNMAAPPYSHPNSGDTPNRYLTYVIDVADMPGVALSRLMVSGEYVEDLQPHDGPQHEIEGMISGETPRLRMTWHDGHQTTADAYMLEHYATHAERPWRNDMIGTGVTYAVMTFYYDREMFNQLPGVRFEVQGIALYDPRADGSVGGSGAQRWNDPTTWARTANPAVIIYNILRGLTLPDGRRWGGQVSADDLPLDNWFAAMNECDLPVALEAGGTEPQYRAGLEVSVDTEPAAVIEELMKACSASISEVGGVYKLRVGPPALPVFFMSDDDVVVDRPQNLAPYPGLDGVHNAIHATHPNPAALWESRDAPPRYNAEWESEDGGRQLVAQVDLPAVASDTQVQRLMQAWIEDERRFRRHSLTLPPEAAVLEPLDAIAWTSAREGYTAKVFEIGEATDDLTSCLQTMALRERDAGDFVWVPGDEIPVTHPSPRPTRPVAREISLLNLEAIALADSTAAGRRPGLLLSWDAALVAAHEGVEYQVQLASGAAVTSGLVADATEGRVVISAGLLPNTAYRARARILGARQGAWSDWAHAATDDLRFDVSDLGDDLRETLQGATRVQDEFDTLVADFPGTLATAFDDVDTALADLGLDLELREIDQRAADEALTQANERLLWLLSDASRTASTFSDAGVYVDPENGQVRIAAVDYQETRISETEIRLNAAEANINLRATQAYVDSAVSNAVLDPTQVPIIGDLQARINTVEIDLDAAEAAISLKADQTVLDGLGLRVNDAEIEIDGINAALSLAVTRAEFDPLETRLNSAEVALDTLDGAGITQTVSDVRHLSDDAALAGVNTLADLLQAYEDRDALRIDLAYATQDLRARVDQDREAMAEQTLALGVAIDENQALLGVERTVRANETLALARDVSSLSATLSGARGDISGNATALSGLTTRVEEAEGSISSQASQISSLSATLSNAQGDISGNATALSGLTTRVEDAEGALSSQAAYLLNLASDLSSAESDISGTATALSGLTTRVEDAEGSISSQASQISSLSATLSNAQGDISGNATALSGLTTRVEDAEGALSSQAAYLLNLASDLSSAESDISGTATALSGLTTRVSDAEGTISSQASQISSLSTTVGDHTATITQTAESVDGIRAEYTLRIDNNGRIGGAVLRSDLDNAGAPLIEMGFVADNFTITSPDGDTAAPPFVVLTTSKWIDGVLVPPGVYLGDAQIRTAGITRAHIANAAIGRAQVADVIESDNYAEDAKGRPTSGMRLNFANGLVKTEGMVISRPLVLKEGSFQPGGTASNGSEYLWVNTGIRIGKHDVWRASRVALVAQAAITSGASGSGGLDPNNSFWACEAEIMAGARWYGWTGGNPEPDITYRRSRAQEITPDWATGSDQRVFLRIKLTAVGGITFPNPNIAWTVFQVT
ncbi:phage tail protein [Sulfitobacter sp. M21595]|uniref:phage tail protein n=1 Tax=Sulfitobacter sp. M21595 TaxID=3368574 RepID=UPI0037461EB1